VRQILISRYGAPEVMVPRDAPSPAPAAGEVRIAVRAAGVNFADVLARVGLYPDAPKPPLVVGYEVAGMVDAIGAVAVNDPDAGVPVEPVIIESIEVKASS